MQDLVEELHALVASINAAQQRRVLSASTSSTTTNTNNNTNTRSYIDLCSSPPSPPSNEQHNTNNTNNTNNNNNNNQIEDTSVESNNNESIDLRRTSGTTPMIGLEQTDLSLSQMLATSNLNDEPTTPFQPLSTSQGMSAILYDDDEEEPPAKATKRRYDEYAANNPRTKSLSESSAAPIKSPFRVASNYAPEQQPKMPAQSILSEILELQKNQKIQLENIRANQRHIISQQQKSETAIIDAEEKQLKSSLENELKVSPFFLIKRFSFSSLCCLK